MSITDLAVIVGFLAALSAAAELIVDFFKTLLNKTLGTPPATEPPPGEPWPPKEIARRVILKIIAFAAAGFSAAWFAQKDAASMAFDPCGEITMVGLHLPVIVAGLLGSAGSKFWKDVLVYVGTLKDIGKENLNAKLLQRSAIEQGNAVAQANAVAQGKAPAAASAKPIYAYQVPRR